MSRNVSFGPTVVGRSLVASALKHSAQAMTVLEDKGVKGTELDAIVARGDEAQKANTRVRAIRAELKGGTESTFESLVERDAELRSRLPAVEGDINQLVSCYDRGESPIRYGLAAADALTAATIDAARADAAFMAEADFSSYRLRVVTSTQGSSTQGSSTQGSIHQV